MLDDMKELGPFTYPNSLHLNITSYRDFLRQRHHQYVLSNPTYYCFKTLIIDQYDRLCIVSCTVLLLNNTLITVLFRWAMHMPERCR